MGQTTPTPTMQPPCNWHRLFGLLLSEHLAGSPFVVELEKDLSQKQQLLDVIIVRRGPGKLRRPLPDGLDHLVAHNLITFKSFREPLDDWALKELTGHYVNYRKQLGGRGAMLSETAFGLYAVCARTPRELFAAVAPEPVQEGVYLCRRGSDAIRVVVAAELPQTEHNALLHLFSAAVDQVQYGVEHYALPSADVSTIVNRLFAGYRQEGLIMPYTMQDFRKEVALEILDELSPEERLRGLPAEERLRGLPAEERMRGLPAEERMRGLPAEERLRGLPAEERMRGLPAEERLRGLPATQIEAYLSQLRKEPKSSRRKKRNPKR